MLLLIGMNYQNDLALNNNFKLIGVLAENKKPLTFER